MARERERERERESLAFLSLSLHSIVRHMESKEFREDEELCMDMLLYFRMMMEKPPDLGEAVSHHGAQHHIDSNTTTLTITHRAANNSHHKT